MLGIRGRWGGTGHGSGAPGSRRDRTGRRLRTGWAPGLGHQEQEGDRDKIGIGSGAPGRDKDYEQLPSGRRGKGAEGGTGMGTGSPGDRTRMG